MDNGTKNSQLKPVTDPNLLNLLDGKQVTDPNVLAQLNGGNVTQPPPQGLSLGNAVMQGISNLPSSAVQFAKNIVAPIVHPIETSTGILKMAAAGTAPQTPESQALAQQIGKYFVDRYGGLENLKKTFAEDPVGMLVDASTLLTGAGAAAKVGGLSRTANVLSKAGSATDPIQLATSAVGSIAKGVGSAGAGVMGTVTGEGRAAIEQAAQGGQAFTQALRGKTSQEDVLSSAQSAIQDIKKARELDYTTKLQNLTQNQTVLDKGMIKNTLYDLMKRFNISRNTDTGKLDFSRSTLSSQAYNDVKNVIDMTNDWGSRPADLTPAGLDVLKRKIGDYYTDSNNGKVFIGELARSVKKVITDNVPEYENMVKPYEQSKQLEDEITKVLSLKSGGNPDAAIRKLSGVLRDNNEFRSGVLSKLESASNTDIRGQIAGLSLNKTLPSSFIGRGIDVAAVYTGIAMADPKLAGILMMTSPRVVGEFLNALGYGIRGAKQVAPFVKAVPDRSMYQVGRLGNQ